MTAPFKLVRIPSLKTTAAFREHLAKLGLDLGLDEELLVGESSPLRQKVAWGNRTIGNRWAIHPMEGWDGTATGGVTEPMIRRWQRFGESGAKLIWGGEAMAVRPDGRANPRQLIINRENMAGIAQLRETLLASHREKFGATDDVVIGFQLTHSGRFCRPHSKTWESRIAYRHPLLDAKFNVTSDEQVFTDEELRELVVAYITAAKVAAEIGADFVDIKHCHGYLLHEFLGAHTRPGPYGGSFENRTRLLREIVEGIRAAAPSLGIGVRLSAFDFVPFKPDPTLSQPAKPGPGMPEDFSKCLPYRYGFGVNQDNPLEYDLRETKQFLQLLSDLGITLVNLSAGSPYYNPHIQRPAAYPPSDGYQPHEDPLISVVRQLKVVAELKAAFPNLLLVGSAYSYLQDFLPNVAQYYVRNQHVDFVGLGRTVLSYPHMLADATTAGKLLEPKLICRTFSDCTTAPRIGLRSGCYPLDPYYKTFEDAAPLKAFKSGAAS
jgi:2,4-dienoyl-CoA reductase-like NADH-dependent reductase (Old Yellow Enzyme family)